MDGTDMAELSKFDLALQKDAPVRAKIPCRNCIFLQPVVFHDNTKSDSYMECTYKPQKVKGTYWQYPKEYTAPETWRAIKYIDGPFADDAEIIKCEVRISKVIE